MIKLSDQQEAIVQAVADNDKDIQVTARAGCGKTFTILRACKVAGGKVAFFAFNKSIATELAQKAPNHVNVQTLHSLGFRILRQNFRTVKVDADHTYNLIKSEILPDEQDLISPVKKLVGLVKNNLTRLNDDDLYDLCLEYDVDVNGDAPRVFEIVRQVIKKGMPNTSAPQISIDYDDMIYLPSVLGLSAPQFDWTFVDEAQDMNMAQMKLVQMVSEKGRICYVGDPFQAIYKFRGADSAAMDTMRQELERRGRKVVNLPLTRTRRCPKSVVERAKTIVPDFESLPDAPDGKVESRQDLDPEPGDMVLCRLNAPLVPLAYALLRNGIPAFIQGRDIGAGLLALIKRLRPVSVSDLQSKLRTYEQKESQRIADRYKDKPSKMESAHQALRDKVDTLVELASGQTSIDGLTGTIETLFGEIANTTGVVLLSTVHKAKGLEADRVWIQETKAFGGDQEANIKYVAITRAKQELFIVPPRA